MPDQELQTKVKEALDKCPQISGCEIRADVREGTVTLDGCVRSHFQKQMAQETLRDLQGVARVVNDLEVAL